MSQLRPMYARSAMRQRPFRLNCRGLLARIGAGIIRSFLLAGVVGSASASINTSDVVETESMAPGGARAAHLPRPFEATYTADYRGLPISATGIRSLEIIQQDQSSTYTFSSKALSLFAKLNETSTFRTRGTALQPLRYQYERTGLGKNKTQDLHFDWQEGVVTDQAQNDQYSLNREAHFSDRLLYQLQLQVDLFNANEDDINTGVWTYEIFDSGRIKQYAFEVAERELLTTELGPIQTLRLEKKNDDPDKRTTLWLAPTLEYMLIRFIQEDGRNSFSLELQAASIEGEPVKLEE